MNRILRVFCLVIFYFSFSNLFALDYFRYSLIKFKKDYETSQLQRAHSFIEQQKTNFKEATIDGKSITPEQQMILIYLNTLLNKLLTDNKEILDRFGRSSSEFFISFITTNTQFYFIAKGGGEILFDPEIIYGFPLGGPIYDSYIIARLSHEIAHDLLDHKSQDFNDEIHIYDTSSFKDQYTDINEYDFDGDLSNPEDKKRFFDLYLSKNNTLPKLREEHDKWLQFLSKDQGRMDLKRRHEIEADTLGLELYLNTRFKPEDFANQFIDTQKPYDDPMRYTSISLYLQTISNPDIVSEKDRKAIEKDINRLLDSIKYPSPSDEHPNAFWSYWNTLIQIELYKKNRGVSLNSNLVNGLYFRIDLSQSEKLDMIREFFSIVDNLNLEIESDNDPRVYIIEKLFDPRSSISYSLEISSIETKTGLLRNDNTIILKASDVFQIALVKYHYRKLSDSTLDFSCKRFFSAEDISVGFNPALAPLQSYPYIKKAFL